VNVFSPRCLKYHVCFPPPLFQVEGNFFSNDTVSPDDWFSIRNADGSEGVRSVHVTAVCGTIDLNNSNRRGSLLSGGVVKVSGVDHTKCVPRICNCVLKDSRGEMRGVCLVNMFEIKH
jgi:hypothetical protein